MEDETAGREWILLMAKLSEIAGWLGVQGPGLDATIERVSGVEGASGDALVFATDATTLKQACQSGAGGILADARFRDKADIDSRVIWVRNAKLAFAVVAGRLGRREGPGEIDARAVIGEHVVIGHGTRVGPCSRDCSGRDDRPRLRDPGERHDLCGNVGGRSSDRSVRSCAGLHGLWVCARPGTGEYVAFPQQGTLRIEDDVEIGANTTIDRGALGETRIGRGTKIDNLVHIAHNCVIGKNVVIAAQTGISGSTNICDGAVIGGQVGIGDHATIGEGVILGVGQWCAERQEAARCGTGILGNSGAAAEGVSSEPCPDAARLSMRQIWPAE